MMAAAEAMDLGGLAPVVLHRPGAAGPFALVCEHAARDLPPALGDLGLGPADLSAHIAWDPGALGVAQAMAARLDAPLVAGGLSRLVYDLNRPPEAASAIPARSEATDIPGNRGLDPFARAARAAAVHAPFHAALAGLLDARAAAGRPGALATVHSFTPVYLGAPRRVEIGVLHDADARLADALLAALAGCGHVVARNQPYGPADGVTHTLRAHALPRGLPNVMIEVRNDLIADPAAQAAMGALLADALTEAWRASRA